MVKIQIVGKPDEITNAINYFTNLERLGEISIQKIVKSTDKQPKQAINKLYIRIANDVNDVLEDIIVPATN